MPSQPEHSKVLRLQKKWMGHPPSALCALHLFFRPVCLSHHLPADQPFPVISQHLTANLPGTRRALRDLPAFSHICHHHNVRSSQRKLRGQKINRSRSLKCLDFGHGTFWVHRRGSRCVNNIVDRVPDLACEPWNLEMWIP